MEMNQKRKKAILKIKIVITVAIVLLVALFSIIIAQTVIIGRLQNEIENSPNYSSEATLD